MVLKTLKRLMRLRNLQLISILILQVPSMMRLIIVKWIP